MTTNHDALREVLRVAFTEGYSRRATYNDIEVSDFEEEWKNAQPFINEALAASKPEPISDVTEAVTRTVIEVEKLLCEKLGKQWRPSGMSIQTLVDELAASKPEPQPTHSIAGLGRMTDDDCGFVTLQFKDEDSAQAFMQNYSPTVEVDDMPPIQPDASKPEPQAQAGEPEVVAVVDDRLINRCNWKLDGKLKDGEELITLQSHREAMQEKELQYVSLFGQLQEAHEAMKVEKEWTEVVTAQRDHFVAETCDLREALAKKDAALKSCVGALNVVDANNESYVGEKTVAAAITQAKEAMK